MSSSGIIVWSNEYKEDEQYCEDMHQEEITNLVSVLNWCVGAKPMLLVDAKGLDWEGNNGYKVINIAGADYDDIYNSLMPDYECSVRIYKSESNKFYMMVSSHDVPTGSIWWLSGIEDVESVIEDIEYNLKGNRVTLQEFHRMVGDKLRLDISTWEHNILDTSTNRISIGGGAFEVCLSKDLVHLEDGIESYDIDSIKEDYYRQYLRA